MTATFTHYQQASELPTPLCCIPMSQTWKDGINKNKWWASGYTGGCLTPEEMTRFARYRTLIDTLLTFGGEEVCFPAFEPDFDDIVSHGVFLYGDGAKFVTGNPSDCHANSCRVWRRDPKQYQIMTGYALSNDGMWRQHSWCIERKSGRPIETTNPRLGYYGFVLSFDQARTFCQEN